MAYDKNGKVVDVSSKDIKMDALGGVDLDTAVKEGKIGNKVINTLQGGETDSPPSVAAVNAGLAKKADLSAVQNELGKKANVTEVNVALSKKADATAVNTALQGKANTSDLAGKQDKLTAGSGISIVNNVIKTTGGGGGSVNIDTSIPSSPANDHVPSTALLKAELDKKANAGAGGLANPDAKFLTYTNGSTTTAGGTVADKLTELDNVFVEFPIKNCKTNGTFKINQGTIDATTGLPKSANVDRIHTNPMHNNRYVFELADGVQFYGTYIYKKDNYEGIVKGIQVFNENNKLYFTYENGIRKDIFKKDGNTIEVYNDFYLIYTLRYSNNAKIIPSAITSVIVGYSITEDVTKRIDLIEEESFLESAYRLGWSNSNCLPYMWKDTNTSGKVKECNIIIDTDFHNHFKPLKKILQWKSGANASWCYWCLGDMADLNVDDPRKQNPNEFYVNSFREVWDFFDKYATIPQLVILGNHDLNLECTPLGWSTKQEQYTNVIKPMLDRYPTLVHTDANNLNACYWYADSPTENLRIIGLDVYDYPTPISHNVELWKWWYFSDYVSKNPTSSPTGSNPYNSGFSPTQLKWLVEVLEDASSKGKAVVLGGHYLSALDWFVANSGYKFLEILKAFKNKSSGTITTDSLNIDNSTDYQDNYTPQTINFDFTNSNNSGKVFCLNGHVHYSQYAELKDSNNIGSGIYAYTCTCVDGNTPYIQGGFQETADILVYDSTNGIRLPRYGGCGTIRQGNNTTGAKITILDNRGFFNCDEPIKL